MAIGDNHNDLEMLAFAGIPVVMGNSVPELKAFGWHETGTNDESGRGRGHRALCIPGGRIVRLRQAALLLSLALLGAPAVRAEYVVLRSGQRLTVTSYQLNGDTYRLQMAGGSVEIAAEEVVAIEPEEVFTRAPATPAVKPPYRELVEGGRGSVQRGCGFDHQRDCGGVQL